jgi:hypothetical protein
MLFFKKIRKNNAFVKVLQRRNNNAFSEEDFKFILEFEKERADRGNHQFSLIVFDKERYGVQTDESQHLIDNIFQRIRDIDIVGWLNGDGIGIILPYTPTEGANQLVKYIYESMNSPIPDYAYSVYTYPSGVIYSDENIIDFFPMGSIEEQK